MTEESKIWFWQMFPMIWRIQTLLQGDRQLVYIRNLFLLLFLIKKKKNQQKHTNTKQHSDQSFWSRQCQLLGCKGNWWLNLGTALRQSPIFGFITGSFQECFSLIPAVWMCLWERISLCDGDVRHWCQCAPSGWAEFGRHSLVRCPVGEGSFDPSHCALIPAHHQCCYQGKLYR